MQNQDVCTCSVIADNFCFDSCFEMAEHMRMSVLLLVEGYSVEEVGEVEDVEEFEDEGEEEELRKGRVWFPDEFHSPLVLNLEPLPLFPLKL